MNCLDAQIAEEFLRGKMPRERMVEIGDHVTGCPRCKELIRQVAGRSFSSLGDLFDDEDTLRRARPPEAGKVLGGRFRIVKLLGEGAMGVVYEAHDQLLDTRVALKFLKGSMSSNQTLIGRIKREILVGRRIGHPNVAKVFDLWTTEDGGQSYIQMELLSGETLDAVLKRGPVAPALAASLLVQVAGALEAAHREGVVHRDLKPSNLMVDGAGKITVTDFGLASDLRSDGNLSVGSGPIGTPAFWAPEQARCEAVTPASDVFSYGVLAHFVLIGEYPAVGAPLSHRIPSRFRPILERCLQSEPAKRFPSGAELMRALEQARVLEPRRRTSLLAWAAGAAVVAGIGIGVALWTRPFAPPATPALPVRQPEPVRVPVAVPAGPDAAAAGAEAGPDAAVAVAVVQTVKAPEPKKPVLPPVKANPVAKPVEAPPDAGAPKVAEPAPVPKPVPEAPKVDTEALAKLRERLGRVEGGLMARHIRAQDLDQFPEAVAAARAAVGASKVDDAAEAVSRAEAIAASSKIDQAFVDRKTKRLSKLRGQVQLDAATGKSVDESFVEASRAFFKKDYARANEHLETVQRLLEKTR